MRQLKAFFLCAMLFIVPALEAGSVKLKNDSPYQLQATIRGSDGSTMGSMVVNAQNWSAWTDTFQGYSRPDLSQTPYTVEWYCMDGTPFSVYSGVQTGGVATALGGAGSRQCRGKNTQSSPQQQQQQNAQPQGQAGMPQSQYCPPCPACPEPYPSTQKTEPGPYSQSPGQQ